MMRFIVYDEFGGALRAFIDMVGAKQFIRNKNGCTIKEISIFDLVEECLI